jgi:hypothetical protein
MAGPLFVIDHPSQLNALSPLPGLRPLRRLPVSLGGSLADHPRRKEWEAAINRNFLACGCSASSKGLLLGIMAGGLFLVLRAAGGADGLSFWSAAGLVLGPALAGAVAGKLAGLAMAGRRLRAAVADVQANWKVEPAPEGPTTACG